MLSHTWTRIALSYAVLVLVMGGLLALLLGGEFERREQASLSARLTDEAHAVAHDAAPLFAQASPVTDTTKLAHSMSSLFGTRVTLIRPDGLVVGDSEENPALMENHRTRPEVEQVLSDPKSVGSSSRLSATVNRQLLYVAVAVRDPATPSKVVGIARVAYPLTAVEQSRDALWWTLSFTVLIVSLLAIVLGMILARSIVGPLSRLRDTARRFGSGDLTARSQITSDDEIGDLSRELNSTADRVSGLIRSRTEDRNRMAAVLEHMHDGVILTNGQSQVESMNPAAARLFGVAPEAAIGRSLIELTHDHELHTALRSTLSTPIDWQRLEIEVGNNTILAVVTEVPNPAGGEPTGLVVLQNVTELRRLERARRDFVANIGHEIRTPLTSIKLLVETLSTAIDEDPESAKGFLQRIDVEVDGLTQLVREVLELSRIESGRVQLNRRAIPVTELLERAAMRLRAQASRAGLSLDVEAGTDVPPANADAERVEQVLVNLLHNAIKFTNPGGVITLRAEPHEQGVLISVSDTGVGIPPDDVPRIFERFYKVDKSRTAPRDRESGTGLGLAIAKHLVQAHGGQIWVESTLGQGTTFFFTLPAAGDDAQPSNLLTSSGQMLTSC
jgi:two-component system, OmpR family, phosphate regulon sensor histidine kinase PhoR